MNAKQVFLNYVCENDLVDIWRERNPDKLEYTWSRNNPLKRGRLDKLFVNIDLISSVTEAVIEPGYRTDHSLVVMKMRVKEVEKGSGIWKMNDSVLQDSEYVELVNTTIVGAIIQYAIPIYDHEYLSDINNYSHIQFTINESLFL